MDLDSRGSGEEAHARTRVTGPLDPNDRRGRGIQRARPPFNFFVSARKGIVTYAEASEHLPRILREVLAGGFWVPRAVLSRFVEATVTESAPRRPVGRTPTLTPREREVLDELLKNLSNKEIARKLRISGRTAKFHVSNVLAKYGVKRRADLFLLSFPEH